MKYNLDDLIDDCLIGNSDFSQHALTLFSLILSLKPKKILELGVRNGSSTKAILKACSLIDSKLTSIDLEMPRFICPHDLIKHWNFIQSDSIKYLQTNLLDFDFYYIDDWHGSDHVYQELNYIKNKISLRTVVVLHDLMHSFSDPQYNLKFYPPKNEFEGQGPYGGVKKFIEENTNFEFSTIPTNHGLTILRKAFD
jgi:predicted O-methyltransferase YrrM